MFKVKFWGVRGSYPVPGAKTLRYGGNTTCVEVSIEKSLIILDAGTGIIPLGKELIKNSQNDLITANIFFSHTHHDHVEGLAFFEPAYRGSTTLYLFGPKSLSLDLKEILIHEMLPPYFPISLEEMHSTKLIKDISDSEAILIDVHNNIPEIKKVIDVNPEQSQDRVLIRVLKGYNHPRGGVFIYSIEFQNKRVIFATDIEGYLGGDVRLIEFARGADVLIHDTQFLEEDYSDPEAPKQGWGHSTVQMALEVAKKAEVGQLILFHHHPGHDDEKVEEKEKLAKSIFPNSIAAYEGLELLL